MKTFLKLLGVLLGVLVLGLGGFFMWAKSAVASQLSRTFEVHEVDIPVPFPLDKEEVAALRQERAVAAAAAAPAVAAPAADAAPGEAVDDEAQAQAEPPGAAPEGDAAVAEPAAPADPLSGVDLDAIAMERAIARGKHLVEARYACIECHGKDFSGGVMVDDPAMGQLLGPNITTGAGGKTAGYKPRDWDRIVRHGVKPDGTPAVMPSEDFQLMSDQELSDIIAYLRTRPAVDNAVPAPSFGPLGMVLAATGNLPLSADIVGDHHKAHTPRPPETRPTAEFGRHLAGICTGCHRAGLEGGPIAVGPPDWAPARNLTPHADGLAGFTYDDFVKAMREGVRRDGTVLKMPMSLVMPYAQKMKDVELRALWAYISTLPALPTGK